MAPCTRAKHENPAFPLILMLGGDIIVRSNWRTFLSEFSEVLGDGDVARLPC